MRILRHDGVVILKLHLHVGIHRGSLLEARGGFRGINGDIAIHRQAAAIHKVRTKGIGGRIARGLQCTAIERHATTERRRHI